MGLHKNIILIGKSIRGAAVGAVSEENRRKKAEMGGHKSKWREGGKGKRARTVGQKTNWT